MKTISFLSSLCLVLASLALSSCGCCTGEEKPPALRPLPQFSTPPAINYEK